MLSQRGLCTGNQCIALFQQPEDFSGAQKNCKDFYGQLFGSNSTEVLTSLLSGLSGAYWLELPGTRMSAEETTAGLQNCSSVIMVGRNFTFLSQPCREKLNGFLCQYAFVEPCSRLEAGEGAQVKYTTHVGFEVNDSTLFLQGTIAVVEKAGAKYPESKHVCVSRQWMRAPWTCEVMEGGCDHSCNSTTGSCICPAGQTLHPNNITCTKEPCADCELQSRPVEVKRCNKGFKLAQDGKKCVDINECEEESPCTEKGEECVNTQGAFECRCKDDFLEEDGECVDVSICEKCEHIQCEKYHGFYECVCRKGFRVSAQDPTKCEQHCSEQDCPAYCIPNPDQKQKDMIQCFCPDGYIHDNQNDTYLCTDINECENEKQCEHKCENLFGSYRCLCDEGFELHDEYMCVHSDDDEDGSGLTPQYSTPPNTHPAAVPSYVKTGSVLGITMFLALCAALVYFLVRNMVKRCGKLELSHLKGSDMDIFYLQQVTTDTYKRLSFDKQFKNDSPQRL